MFRSVISFVFAAALIVPLIAVAASKPEAGNPAPDFTLQSQEGTPVSLKDLRGQWVVLYFYPKDFTSGCTIEAHNFERDIDQYKKLNATIVGVSLDSVDSHKKFCVKEGLNFKLLSDADQAVSKEYGVLTNMGPVKYASRNTFLIDPQGKIAKVFPDVKPQEHSAEVLATIAEMEKK